MKRLLSCVLAVCLLLSLALPASAEDTENSTACQKTTGCTLPDGHEGECSVPSPAKCTLTEGCILEAGHADACRTETADSNASSANGSNIATIEESGTLSIDSIPAWSVTAGGSYTGQILLDGKAFEQAVTLSVTDSSGNSTDGITWEPAENSDVLNNYTFHWNTAGSYRIYAALGGTTYGPVTVTVNPITFTGDNVPAQGMYFYHDNQYDAQLSLNVGSTFNTCVVLSDGNGTATALTSGLTVSEGLTLTPNGYGAYQLSVSSAGTHTITYGSYTLQVTGTQNGSGGSSGDDLSTAPSASGLYFRLNENGEIRYLNSGINFSGRFGAPLALVKDGTSTPVYDYVGEVGDEIDVQLRFGQPSQSLTAYSGELTVSDGLSLTKRDGGGNYTLKILTEGSQTITCTEDGKTYTLPVTAHPKSAGGAFFALQGTSSTPCFTSALIAGETQTLRFCYGSYGDYQVLTADQLTITGDAVTVTPNGEAVNVAYNQNGQSLIQYTDGDNITHNYVVKCYTGIMERDPAYFSDQGYNATVNIPDGDREVTVGYAFCMEEEMVMWPGNTFNEPADSTWDIWEELVVGAMYAGDGNSVTEPAAADFYTRISNMNLSILSCTNTVANPNGGQNLTVSAAGQKQWKGRTLSAAKFQGTAGLYFESTLLMTFDVDMGDGVTCRFYRTAPVNYKALPDDTVELNITDADVLNTLLSNSYTLINYLEDKVDGFCYNGGNLTLTLPAVTYDKLIVSQMILPGSIDVMGIFTIQGSTDASGSRTTMPGIYSKGFLHGVENIDFVANPNAKMTFNGEEFTCGLLVNNTSTDFQPDFDLATLRAYHPEFQGLTDEEAQELYAVYAPSVPTTGNSYNMGSITNCSFTGFEYAMRTDQGGFVQGCSNCTIRHCKYGVYINAGGLETLHTDGRADTTWRSNTFFENWVPVRITGLPDDLSPYYIRFIDNCFWRNNTDFWVSCGGRFYFYRNYYNGAWKDDYRHGYWSFGSSDVLPNTLMTLSDTTDEARAANLITDSAVLVTNPCRSQPDSTENLWIYDSEGQYTMIFQSDADAMLVDPEAILDLTETVEIPILNDQEQTVGTWTVYEGGDAQ